MPRSAAHDDPACTRPIRRGHRLAAGALSMGLAVTGAGAIGAGLVSAPRAQAQPAQPDGPAPSVPLTDPTDIPTEFTRTEPADDGLQPDSVRGQEYWLDELGVRQAWETTRGKGARIAIIDTGVVGSEPDLQGAVTGGADVSGVGQADGQMGLGADPTHGTQVASVAAGRGHGPDHGQGVIGVAPEADVLAVSTALGTDQPGVRSTDEQIPDAVRWAVDHGADVINMSVGSPQQDWPESWDSAFAYAEEHDVLIVVAAGNRGNGLVQVGAPATIPSVLTVGGVDRSGQAGRESSTQGISIDVAAPAEGLVAAVPGGYSRFTGSSGAAPIVAGTAALIRAEHPELSAQEVAHRITATAHDQGAPGPDPLYGHGVLDVRAAVAGDVPPMTEPPLGSMKEWIQVHRRHEAPRPAAAASQDPSLTQQVAQRAEPPRAVQPLNSTGALPLVVLGGFGLLVAGLTLGAVVHIRWLMRRG